MARQARAAVEDLERSLPEHRPDVDAELSAKRKALEGMESEKLRKYALVKEALDGEVGRVKDDCRDAIAGKQAAWQQEKDDIAMQVNALQSKLGLAEQAFRQHSAACEAERDKQIAEAKAEANKAYIDFVNSRDASLGKLVAESATLVELQKQQIRLEQSLEMVEKRRAEAQAHDVDSDRLTRILTGLDALEGKLLGDLPIAGLAYTNGELTKGGIAIGRLNRAQQVGLSFSVARMGGSPFIVADNLECLDSETFAQFEKAALAMPGVQFLVTRVTDDEFSVVKK
jgi:hypothetical protein